jgi:hypothetical protein
VSHATANRKLLTRASGLEPLHWDNDQKYVELAFTKTSTVPSPPDDETDALLVQMPEDTACAPGWYMLFAIESDGTGIVGHRVPSVGQFIRLK